MKRNLPNFKPGERYDFVYNRGRRNGETRTWEFVSRNGDVYNFRGVTQWGWNTYSHGVTFTEFNEVEVIAERVYYVLDGNQ